MKTIFQFDHYREFFKVWIESRPQGGHGERTKIARAILCEPAYLSQVLGGKAQLSLEQGEALGRYMELTEDEADFLFLLIQKDRAGTQNLRQHFEKKIQRRLDERLLLKNRLDFKKELSYEDQARYYSAWYYAVFHLACAIPGIDTIESLVDCFRVERSKVEEAIVFLERAGLLTRKSGRLSVDSPSIHLGIDSPFLSRHHSNWRIAAIRSLDAPESTDLHYSSVVSVSHEVIPRIRQILVEAIEKTRSEVKSAKDEVMYCYNLDLFRIK